ncbi:hypothetical protein SAMN05216316_2093 [Nitrosovibrio sp. Nv6]|nr:hypothetical protein SAMN05216316_2093 [Nitrosovibrio sp. Nv6]
MSSVIKLLLKFHIPVSNNSTLKRVERLDITFVDVLLDKKAPAGI